MKLYRFLKRSFHGGRIVEPGEEVLLPDDVYPGEHMVDVYAEATATAPAPGSARLASETQADYDARTNPMATVVYRAELANNPEGRGIYQLPPDFPPRTASETDEQFQARARAAALPERDPDEVKADEARAAAAGERQKAAAAAVEADRERLAIDAQKEREAEMEAKVAAEAAAVPPAPGVVQPAPVAPPVPTPPAAPGFFTRVVNDMEGKPNPVADNPDAQADLNAMRSGYTPPMQKPSGE